MRPLRGEKLMIVSNGAALPRLRWMSCAQRQAGNAGEETLQRLREASDKRDARQSA
jgi:hypothetical protein